LLPKLRALRPESRGKKQKANDLRKTPMHTKSVTKNRGRRANTKVTKLDRRGHGEALLREKRAKRRFETSNSNGCCDLLFCLCDLRVRSSAPVFLRTHSTPQHCPDKRR
jgi:hypothetical protein